MKSIVKDRRLKFAALALLLCSLLFAIAPARNDKSKDTSRFPFEPYEELVYDGDFSRAILRNINIAELRFKADHTQAATIVGSNNAASPLHFTLEAESKGIVRKLFGLNFHQRIESTVEPASFSVLQTTKLDEQGKRKRTSEAVFDRTAGKITWTERDPTDPNRAPRIVTSALSGDVQDLASAFYYLRTQPLEVGRSFEILVSDSGQVYRIPVAITERKKMKTVLGEVQTLKVEPEIFGEGRLMRGKGKLTLWLTDDARHIPVRAHINNEMGTLDVKLKSVTGSRAGEPR
ncbi:MAG TPA: DUF3108 domain-containing protein [Pyrinomonadaceae bacterium]|nr:DUF3108 domain-containing protein [Pyrinomonadaceae bacterium]